jgi:hypothetical protein
MEENTPHGGDSLLSPDLKASFDALNSIVRAQKRLQHQTTTRIENEERGKKRKVSSADLEEEKEYAKELEDRKFEVALATALTAEAEISRLQSGIAELESLLLQEGDGNSSADVPFPSLPPYVIPDFDTNETEISTSSVELSRSGTDGPYYSAHAAKEEMSVVKRLPG